jgi:glycosyltransferase involved in cell wall biosynthesis
MHQTQPVDITVLICTRNRAALLPRTLESLAAMTVPPSWRWEVLVVDNGSTDDTWQIIEKTAKTFPVPLRGHFEAQPGKSSAMNSGLRVSQSRVVACVDDDVIVSRDWLASGCTPLMDESSSFAYTGGPVEPVWESGRPSWFPATRADLWGTVAILDYGSEPFVFEDERRVPLGANVAFLREAIDRAGGFVTSLGRSNSRVLLGQELPEFFRRTRAFGVRGKYVPAMRVAHWVPAARLTRSYFRRWWFGKGVSRARVDRLHPVTELGLDLRSVRHIAGVPRFMFGDLLRDLGSWARALLKGDRIEAMERQTRACYFAGYAWERIRSPRAESDAHAS